jgi:phenylalanyl-tRNA synthetase beta chain
MPTRIPLNKPKDVNYQAENTIKHYLADIGWQEAYTYSMVSKQLAEASGYPIDQHAKLLNDLTEDKVYLRRSLIPSLQEVITNNSQLEKLSVFELANVYHPQEQGLPNEELRLAMVSTKPFRQVKGDLESLLEKFYLTGLKVDADSGTNSGKLLIDDQPIGSISISNQQTLIEITIDKLLPLTKTHPTYQPLPKTASIIEQFTFSLPPRTEVGPVIKDIKKLSKLIKTVGLADIYQTNYTLTVEYWDPTKNLSSEEVKPIRQKIVAATKKQHQAKHIGKVQ